MTLHIGIEEWETRYIRGFEPSPEDRASLAAIAETGRLDVDQLADGLRIRAKHWVGSIGLTTISIQILPKVARSNLNVLRMVGYASGISALERLKSERQMSKGDDLLELLILLIAEASEKLVRNGLHADYIEQDEALPYVRGRIRITPYITSRASKPTTVPCTHDEHTTDIDDNRLLAGALALAYARATSRDVKRRVRATLEAFEEACGGRVEPSEAADIKTTYHRLNAHYQEAHALARVLFEGFSLSDARAQSTRSFAFLIDMNRLFELFLLRLLESLAASSGASIAYQESHRGVIVDTIQSRPARSLRPDYILTARTRRRLPIDAKYKYRTGGADDADVYQAFLYAYTISDLDTTLVIHPKTDPHQRHERLRIQGKGRDALNVHTHALDLPIVLEEALATAFGTESQALVDSINQCSRDPSTLIEVDASQATRASSRRTPSPLWRARTV